MANYVERARQFWAEMAQSEPIEPSSGGATSVESPEIEPDPEEAVRASANAVLGRAGVRLMALEGGVWSDLDCPELRAAIAVFHPDGVPPVRYLDGDVPMRFKLRRVPGEPVPLDVLHAMEQNPWTPWETRDRMLNEMGWCPQGTSWAEWKAAALNRLFLEQGLTGKPGRIRAKTVRDGEQKAARLTEESECPMASKSSKARAPFEAANREAAVIVLADPERYPAGSLLTIWARLVLNPPAERTKQETGRAA